MVLKGEEEGDSIPFDAPLYSFTQDKTIEYWNCEALIGIFQTTPQIEKILPEGLELYSDPPQAGFWLSHYSNSTVGPYYEWLSLIMVEDDEGDFGYYIPYIYVTNDAALAAGREAAGAPKKLAKMNIDRELEFINGQIERPEGKRLATINLQPQTRAPMSMLENYLGEKTFLYSVRHLPPLDGEGGVTQLIKWYAKPKIHKDPEEQEKVWMGPVSFTYDSHSNADPIHKLEIEEILAALYAEFDMSLGFEKILKKY